MPRVSRVSVSLCMFRSYTIIISLLRMGVKMLQEVPISSRHPLLRMRPRHPLLKCVPENAT